MEEANRPDDPRPSELTEEQIDNEIADSFPASDPPSFTPQTGVGEPAPDERDPKRDKRS